jgi:hypothetical protein
MPKIHGIGYQISHCGERCPRNSWAADLAVGQAIVFGGLPSSSTMRRRQTTIVCTTPAPELSSYFKETELAAPTTQETLRAFVEGHWLMQ